MIKVLIADDHSVVRQGLQTFLALDPEIEVVGAARNGLEAVEMAGRLHPQVILLDLMMPQMDGFEAIPLLRKEVPQAHILVLTSVLDESTVARAVLAGANGYLLKNMEAAELCQTIKATSSGHVMISPEAALLLAGGVVNGLASTNPLPPHSRSSERSISAAASLEMLTEREIEVLRLVAEGRANKEIARSLGLSEGTIKTHVSIILAKLGLQSRTQAAIYASNAGLLLFSPDETTPPD